MTRLKCPICGGNDGTQMYGVIMCRAALAQAKAENEHVQRITRERDGARAEVERLTREKEDLTEQVDGLTYGVALEAHRADGLKAERDEARDEVERVDRLYDEVAEALDAAGILIREDGTQQAERVRELVADRDALRSRTGGFVAPYAELVRNQLLPHSPANLPESLAERLGAKIADLLFYVFGLCIVLGLDVNPLLAENSSRVQARFPRGYEMEGKNSPWFPVGAKKKDES